MPSLDRAGHWLGPLQGDGKAHYQEADRLLRIEADTEPSTLAAECQHAAIAHALLAIADALTLSSRELSRVLNAGAGEDGCT